MGENRLDGFADAYRESFDYHDENIAILQWYSQRVTESMKSHNLGKVISLGIGHKIVSKRILSELGEDLEKYLIIEGSSEIIEEYKKEVPDRGRMQILHSLFEEFKTDEKFDAIEMGFVLEHVHDPIALLRQFARYLKPSGTVFLAVPNARSLHRLIGYSAGVLDDLYRLSEADLELGHVRYYDLESLLSTILQAGLRVVRKEGLYMKPFSTAQIRSLGLSPEVFTALFSVGVFHPDITNAIYVEATC